MSPTRCPPASDCQYSRSLPFSFLQRTSLALVVPSPSRWRPRPPVARAHARPVNPSLPSSHPCQSFPSGRLLFLPKELSTGLEPGNGRAQSQPSQRAHLISRTPKQAVPGSHRVCGRQHLSTWKWCRCTKWRSAECCTELSVVRIDVTEPLNMIGGISTSVFTAISLFPAL
jgi:hypothetical protein